LWTSIPQHTGYTISTTPANKHSSFLQYILRERQGLDILLKTNIVFTMISLQAHRPIRWCLNECPATYFYTG